MTKPEQDFRPMGVILADLVASVPVPAKDDGAATERDLERAKLRSSLLRSLDETPEKA